MSQKSVIITAGGLGKRMGSELPKQFLVIGGKPILVHTLELFHKYDPEIELILTLPNEWRGYWETLIDKYYCRVPHLVVNGGEERYHSIQNALKRCTGEYIAVHDGVRPFVSFETLNNCFNALKEHGAVVPVLKLKESIRQINEETTFAVNRNAFRLVHTPQCFRAEVLRKAYEQPFHENVTDDACLVEETGIVIHLVESNEENIKLTTQYDLMIAEMIIQKNRK
ncbi:MAG: 2-C-methyl-D-erythritol 4-phosphate cytidylyltransferase [Crocinitomicaceae bacterium]|jgi:2-C-methyl-D-erythritol 4-phosphate cytidylyltransferase